MSDLNLFYLKLKEHRESNDISLEEISDFTKIDIKYLSAIEEGDFSCLPNVYMRLFLRSYCEYMKADFTKALNDYELHTIGEVVSEPLHRVTKPLIDKNETDNLIDESDLNLPPVTKSQVITIVVTMAILFFIFYLISNISGSGDSLSSNETIKEQPISSEIDGVEYSALPNDELLTNIEFEDNLLSKNSKILDSEFAPYIFTVKPLSRTKIHIDNNGKIINKILEKDEYLSVEVNSVIKFDFWSASHIDCKLNH